MAGGAAGMIVRQRTLSREHLRSSIIRINSKAAEEMNGGSLSIYIEMPLNKRTHSISKYSDNVITMFNVIVEEQTQQCSIAI